MVDYAEWRDIEREFRELCRDQPLIRATETPEGWIVLTNKAERFKGLAGIAAVNASGAGKTWNNWLDLLKQWLLETASDLIDCSSVESAGGIEAPVSAEAKNIYDSNWPKISPDDPRLKRHMLCTIRSACDASADYCLELARSSLEPRTLEKLAMSKGVGNGLPEGSSGPQKSAAPRPVPPRNLARAAFVREGDPAAEPLQWEGIKISFFSDERVRIQAGARMVQHNYGELGFNDLRSHRPNQGWLLLRELAIHKGVLPNVSRDSKQFLAIDKRIQRLRRSLQDLFGIFSDPLP